MGLFNLRKKASEPGPLSLRFKEVGSYVQSLDGLKEERARATELCSRLSAFPKAIRDSANDLIDASFEKKDQRYAAVNMAKDSMATKVLNLVSEFPPAPGHTFREMSEYSDEANRILKELGTATPKQAVLVSRYFKEEASDLITSLKEATTVQKELSALLSSANRLRLEQDVQDIFNSIEGNERKIAELRKVEKEYKTESNGLEERAAAKKKELDNLLKSKEWDTFNRQREEMDARTKEADAIRSGLSEDLSPLKRPFKKLMHSGKISVSDPMELLGQGKLDFAIAKALDSGIELKPRERSKITAIKERRDMGSLLKKAESLDEKAAALKTEIISSRLSASKQILESDVAALVSRSKGFMEEYRKSRELRQSLENDIRGMKDKLSGVLSGSLGRPVTITE